MHVHELFKLARMPHINGFSPSVNFEVGLHVSPKVSCSLLKLLLSVLSVNIPFNVSPVIELRRSLLAFEPRFVGLCIEILLLELFYVVSASLLVFAPVQKTLNG